MIDTFGLSEPGGHVENQDAWDCWPHPHAPNCFLCVVADGQGGRAGGGAAARLAVRTCRQLIEGFAADRLLEAEAWPDLLGKVDATVAADDEAGYTTLVALAVCLDRVAGASSGDSAAALYQGEGPGRILTARQWKNPPVGSGEAVFVPFAAVLTPPWTVLALTDGVWKYAGWETIGREARRPGTELIPAVRQRAVLPGSGALPDDFTLAVLQGRVK